MSNTFGSKFILVNDVRQTLPPEIFGGGPWIHLATVKRGFKEYCCFKHYLTDKIYIEEFDQEKCFVRIEDDNEWKELYQFLLNAGVLYTGSNKEFKIATEVK